jgi:hypothetical protein
LICSEVTSFFLFLAWGKEKKKQKKKSPLLACRGSSLSRPAVDNCDVILQRFVKILVYYVLTPYFSGVIIHQSEKYG